MGGVESLQKIQKPGKWSRLQTTRLAYVEGLGIELGHKRGVEGEEHQSELAKKKKNKVSKSGDGKTNAMVEVDSQSHQTS